MSPYLPGPFPWLDEDDPAPLPEPAETLYVSRDGAVCWTLADDTED